MPVMVMGPSSELSSWSLEFTEHCCCYHPAGPISGTGDGYSLRQMAHVISCSSRQNTPDMCVCNGCRALVGLGWGNSYHKLCFLVSGKSAVCCVLSQAVRNKVMSSFRHKV